MLHWRAALNIAVIPSPPLDASFMHSTYISQPQSSSSGISVSSGFLLPSFNMYVSVCLNNCATYSTS
ncbi:hypothetical protein ACSS6W_003848 [Trichoderma asperelloides]